ncbi:helix-turn-helix domain-containing protein [Streptacidiphilus carbonis]|uniref:helix-turn-helix domain-containing protein n=1 Tax=Streptacidiphilus carbonis TaxID=105422 RepID=UPI000A0584EC|nr:XRE family transcriptional regulator [Streptacidiphilus carbonis]
MNHHQMLRQARTSSQRQCVVLAAELRLLRERSGLTIAALAEESAYSRSSWQRYLTGAALPPWLAVRALCHLAGEPEPRIRALWELAEAAWSGRGGVASVPAAPPPPAPAPEPERQCDPVPPKNAEESGRLSEQAHHFARGTRTRAVAAVLLLFAALCTAVYLKDHAGGHASAQLSSTTSGFHVGCVGTACNGLDPGTTLCGVEPETLLELLPRNGAGLEVRYQPLCRAAWARTWNNQLGDKLTLSRPGAPTQVVTVTDPHLLDAFSYTPLLAFTSNGAPLKVCLTTFSPPSPSSHPSTTCDSVPFPAASASQG